MQSSTGWLCVLLLVSVSASVDAVQKKSQKRDEQRENEAVRKAQDDLNDVQKDLKQAEGDLREAQQRVRQSVAQRQAAASALQKVIDRLEDEHAGLTGLTAARRDLKAAQTAFDDKADPIRKGLASQPDIQAAEQTLAKVKAALKSVDDHPDADRRQLAKDFTAATAKVREIEQTAIRRDPALVALQAKIDQAEKLVQQALEKFEKAVERDDDLKAAQKTFENAKVAEDKAEQSTVKAAREVASTRAKVAQATQQLHQKKLKDQKDDHRGKNKK